MVTVLKQSVFSALAFLLFLPSAHFVFAQTPCGDFVSFYDYGDGPEEERQSIEDCNNPFNVDEPAPFTAELTINGQSVLEGSVVTVPTTGEVTAEFSITDVQSTASNFAYPPLELYRKVGNDQRLEFAAEEEQFSLTDLPAGEYTAVFKFEEPPVLSQSKSFLKKVLANLFLPNIAYASGPFPDYLQIVTISFTVTNEEVTPEGASSVLFLPGIQASRLYTDEGGNENRLWEPNINSDVEKLAMTESGESINDIYTRDVIDKGLGVVGVYDSFLNQMEDLKTDEVIKDFVPFAYDWRYSVFDVATDDIKYSNDQTKRLVDEVIALADESHTGKVTLIAHSNGGLVAKALLHQYGEDELAGKVDKLIMIGTPQLGTPKAVGSMLHGLKQSIGFGLITQAETVRQVTKNVPGAYTLLPSSKYFEVAGEVLITTDDSELAESVAVYGDIDSASELQSFILDTLDTRGEAVSLFDPLTLNTQIAQDSLEIQDVLDDWKAPAGVEVYEVVGTGLATIKGFEYRGFSCTNNNPLCILNSYLKPFPIMSNDGDETVMAISAEGYEGDKTVAKIDLSDENEGVSNKNRKHRDLTESEAVQTFVESVIRYPYVGDSIIVPDFTEVSSKYTIIAGHSPVSLVATDDSGNHVGVVDDKVTEDIFGSQYFELGDSKYLVIPSEEDVVIEVTGTAEGIYSLTIDEIDENGEQNEVSLLSGASTSPAMKASFSITNGDYSLLEIDTDGDGEIDMKQTLDGEVIEDPTIEYSYDDLKEEINNLDLKRGYKKYLLSKARLAEFFDRKSNRNKLFERLEKRTLESLVWRLNRYSRRGYISEEEFELLIEIINNMV